LKEQQTAQVQAAANSQAQQAAYRSGDPVQAAAASITAADKPWLDALNAAASVVF
jgi:hypothetical protein